MSEVEDVLGELAAAAREYRDIKEDVSFRQLAARYVSNEDREKLAQAKERLEDALVAVPDRCTSIWCTWCECYVPAEREPHASPRYVELHMASCLVEPQRTIG